MSGLDRDGTPMSDERFPDQREWQLCVRSWALGLAAGLILGMFATLGVLSI